jgi:hypothetical protein
MDFEDAGLERGGSGPVQFLFAHFFVLESPEDFAARCPSCGVNRLFRADRECVWGLSGKCMECGALKFLPENPR